MKKYRLTRMVFVINVLMLFVFVFTGCISIKKEPISQNQSQDYWPDGAWRTSSPEDQGMDSEMLYKMIDFIREQQKEIHSLLIIRNGYLVTEANFYPYQKDHKHVINSCTKSIMSSLIGISIDEGKIQGIDEKVLNYFNGYDIKNLDERKESLKIKHLLTMTAGIDWVEEGGYGSQTDSWTQMWDNDDQIGFILNRPMKNEPGTEFYYNTGGSHLLSGILHNSLGKSTFDYSKEKLFDPIGIKNIYWESDKKGINIGGAGIYMTPSDMSKFGYLYLKKGKWNQKQVIPQDWVETATQKITDTPSGLGGRHGYGYQWWQNSFGGYSARGYGGQYIFVIPEHEMVVAFTSGLSDYDYYLPETLVESFIIPSIKSQSKLNSDPSKKDHLTKLLKEISAEPESKPIPEMPLTASQISGKIFVMEDKSSFKFDFKDNKCTLTIYDNDSEHKIPVSLDDVMRVVDMGNFGPLPTDNKTALKGYWSDEKTFVIVSRELQDIHVLEQMYSFDKDSVILKTSSNMSPVNLEESKGSIK